MKNKKFNLLKLPLFFWSGVFSLGAVLVIGSNLMFPIITQAAGFHEGDTIPCYDASGAGKEILINGVPNAGILQFDVGPGKAPGPAPSFEAFVRMSSADSTVAKPDHLEGWVWNTNLGWVSLYCGDDDHDGVTEITDTDGIKENLGIACGSQDYSIGITASGVVPDFSSVRLSGYGWGDNIGYIAFNGSSWNVELETDITDKGKVQNGAPKRHVWSDAVGWMDLKDVIFPWFNMTQEEFKVCGDIGNGDVDCPCNLVDGKGCTEESVPYADGEEQWKIKFGLYNTSLGIQINNTNSTVDPACTGIIPMSTAQNGPNRYYVCITPVWKDLVDYDQTTLASQDSNLNHNLDATGPVQKPLKSGDIAFNGNLWEGKVSSYAPTSNTNLDDKGRNGEKFVYPEDLNGDGLDYVVSKSSNGSNNSLALERLDVLVFKYGTPGECLYGTVVGTNCVQKSYLQNINLKFKPLLKLNSLYFSDPTQNKKIEFINALANEAAKFEYTIGKQPSFMATFEQIQLNLGLNAESGYKFNFEDTLGSNTYENDLHTYTFDGNKGDGSLQAMALPQDPNSPPAFSEEVHPYLYSIVSYIVKGAAEPTKFFSVKLPRIKAGLIKNPVAFVLGNIYGTALGVKSQDVKVRSLGNLSSNIFRNNIVQNVYKLIAGSTQKMAGGSVTVTGFKDTEFSFSGLMPSKVPGKNVYYVKDGDLIFNCGQTCSWDGKWTFIVENGHVFVDSNLIPNLQKDPNSALGLIALKDLAVLTSKANLYLEAAVTDLYQVNVYLDGAMFSYKNDSSHGVGGVSSGYEPIFIDDYDRQESLSNQFKLYGSLSSANCIGCANAIPPTTGEGQVVNLSILSKYATLNSPAQGIAAARVDDLNYLRYYGPYLELCTTTNIPRDQQLKVVADPMSGCDDTALSYEINATQLVENGGDLIMPTADIGIKAEKADEGDIYPSIFEQFLPPKDLPAFEVQQDVNPIQVI